MFVYSPMRFHCASNASRDGFRGIWLTVLAGLLVLVPQIALANIIPPSTPIAGQTQLDHAHQWWQLMLNIPAVNNPIVDTTGAQAFRGQVGNVLYLAGSFGPSSNRTITISPGTTLFFPLVNSFDDNTFYDPDLTAQQLLDNIHPIVAENLFVELNGVPLGSTSELAAHYQHTDPNNPFTNVVQSPDNLYVDFGIDPTEGTGIYPALINPFVVSGFWVGLEPLGPGIHTLRFGGTVLFPPYDPEYYRFSQDNTYRIIVTPEPTTWALFGLGLVGICAGRRVLRRRPAVAG
ncbi:MAG: PEP-CTERM sorting domain-containing protein [Gemmatales bacterium]|nr:PEP-CTERM sorting domain-containing protein [Gemmatales bacterium]MDW8386273.1 PEP-CTERM sorting domain-containing protein [Gemmatales bacterium]